MKELLYYKSGKSVAVLVWDDAKAVHDKRYFKPKDFMQYAINNPEYELKNIDYNPHLLNLEKIILSKRK